MRHIGRPSFRLRLWLPVFACGFTLASRRDKPGFRLYRNDGEVVSAPMRHIGRPSFRLRLWLPVFACGFTLASRRDKPGFRLRRNDGEIASLARGIAAVLASPLLRIPAPAAYRPSWHRCSCASLRPRHTGRPGIAAPAHPCARGIPAVLASLLLRIPAPAA
jgi:hypothetical protein